MILCLMLEITIFKILQKVLLFCQLMPILAFAV